jgi:hypothetical protein
MPNKINSIPIEIIKEDKTFHWTKVTPKKAPKIIRNTPMIPKNLRG